MTGQPSGWRGQILFTGGQAPLAPLAPLLAPALSKAHIRLPISE